MASAARTLLSSPEPVTLPPLSPPPPLDLVPDLLPAPRRRQRRAPQLPEPISLQSLAPPGAWKLYAACRGLGPERFFPGRGEDQTAVQEICRGCPVQLPCREYGLAAPTLLQGIWGGLNERQRRRRRSGKVPA